MSFQMITPKHEYAILYTFAYTIIIYILTCILIHETHLLLSQDMSKVTILLQNLTAFKAHYELQHKSAQHISHSYQKCYMVYTTSSTSISIKRIWEWFKLIITGLLRAKITMTGK